MEFEKELTTYMDEVDRTYRRSLDAPHSGLTNEQTEAIKKFQFEARNQRERLHKIVPEWLREYRNAKAMMLLAGILPEDYPQLAQIMALSKSEVVAMRKRLNRAAEQLNEALTLRGRPLPLTEKDIVNPIDRSLSPDQKALQLGKLSLQNEPIVKSFIERVDAKYNSRSKYSFKLPKSIEAKASRPSIKAEKNWFEVEHVRDAFRFKTALNNIEDLPKIVTEIKNEQITIVKADTQKMLKPKAWGWKAAMYDLRMPNGQLVEYYLSAKEMIDANEKVCHALYEQWRNRDTETLTKEELRDYQRALENSNSTYREAWQTYLTRTGQSTETIKTVLADTDKLIN